MCRKLTIVTKRPSTGCRHLTMPDEAKPAVWFLAYKGAALCMKSSDIRPTDMSNKRSSHPSSEKKKTHYDSSFVQLEAKGYQEVICRSYNESRNCVDTTVL